MKIGSSYALTTTVSTRVAVLLEPEDGLVISGQRNVYNAVFRQDGEPRGLLKIPLWLKLRYIFLRYHSRLHGYPKYEQKCRTKGLLTCKQLHRLLLFKSVWVGIQSMIEKSLGPF